MNARRAGRVGRGWVAGPAGARTRRRRKKQKPPAGTTPPAITRPGSFMTPFGVPPPHSDMATNGSINYPKITPKSARNHPETTPKRHRNYTEIRMRGGGHERRHETPWACDGWGSGAGRRFLFLFLFVTSCFFCAAASGPQFSCPQCPSV